MDKDLVNADQVRSMAAPKVFTIEELLETAAKNSPGSFARYLHDFKGDCAALENALLLRFHGQEGIAKLRTAVCLMYMGNPLGEPYFLLQVQNRGAPLHHEAMGILEYMGPSRTSEGTGNVRLALTEDKIAAALAPLLAEPCNDTGRKAVTYCISHKISPAQAQLPLSLGRLADSGNTEDAGFVAMHCGAYYPTIADPALYRLLGHADLQIRAIAASKLVTRGGDGVLLAAESILASVPSAPALRPCSLNQWISELCGRVLQCSKQAELPLAQQAARMAQRVIDTIASRPPESDDYKSDICMSGFKFLLESVETRVEPQTSAWLLALSTNPHLGQIRRAMVLAAWMRVTGDHAPEGCAVLQRLLEAGLYGGFILAGPADYVRWCGVAVLPALLQALKISSLRKETASALLSLPPGQYSAAVVAALVEATELEADGWAKEAQAAAMAWHGANDASALAAMNAWDALPYYWKRDGITVQQVASALLTTGATTPTASAAVANYTVEQAKEVIYKLVCEGEPEGWGFFSVTDDNCYPPQHCDLFAELAGIVRPELCIDAVSQTKGELDRMTIVHYVYQHQVHRFAVEDDGKWLKVAAIVGELNAFLARIGRETRVFQLEIEANWEGDSAIFFNADGRAFSEVAARFHIPVATHPLGL